MRIESCFSEQFAGVRNHEARFCPGMNVVLGNNETGKSTMISAVFYALTKSAKLDGRRDREFIAGVFPSGGANTADARVRFVENGRRYEIEKIWDKAGQDAVARLKDPDGEVVRGAQAEKRLAEILRYGTAVYDNLIFDRQDREEDILDWCYRFFSDKSGKDIDGVRRQIGSALSAVGGISPEKFLAELSARMKALDGHWDVERDCPEKNRGLNNPWRVGVGTILEAWYAYQEAEQNCRDMVQTEQEIADTARRLALAQKEKRELTESQAKLLEQNGAVESLSNIQKLKAQAESERRKAEFVQGDWPGQEKRIRQGKEYLTLLREAENREKKAALISRRDGLRKLKKEIDGLSEQLRRRPDIGADYEAVCEIPHQTELARAKLLSGRLHASIRMKNGYIAGISFADGSTRTVSNQADTDIGGYIQLDIPEVAEIQVAQQGVDVRRLQEEIAQGAARLDEILRKYCVSDLRELKKAAESDRETARSIARKESEFKRELDGDTMESLQERIDAIGVTEDLPVPENLDMEIREFLDGARSLDAAVSMAEQKVREYAAEYTGYEAVAQRAEELAGQIREYDARVRELSCQNVLSADEFDRRLRHCKAQLEEADTRIGSLQNKAGRLGEPGNLTELEAERDRLKEEWQTRRREYDGYRRIRADYEALCGENDDGFSGFYKKFNGYLAMIAGDALTMEDSDGLNIKSGRNRVSRELLSAGTKKTLLLAFRLAVLDYYFPDGDGLVVLDDDLLDMDPTRRGKAAALLKNFADRNQVIFITCDPGIAELLGGNRITLN